VIYPKRRAGYYHIDDEKVYPSVTTILSVIHRPSLELWKIRESVKAALADPSLSVNEVLSKVDSASAKAASRGSAVHKIIEQGGAFSEGLAGYGKAYEAFREAVKSEIIEREYLVYSEKYGYAGTLDAYVRIGERTAILDYKTSKAIYSDYAIQLSAYKQAFEEMKGASAVDAIAVVRLGKDGDWDYHEMVYDFAPFAAALNLWKWYNENN
jgi:predicted RecB family nuclease